MLIYHNLDSHLRKNVLLVIRRKMVSHIPLICFNIVNLHVLHGAHDMVGCLEVLHDTVLELHLPDREDSSHYLLWPLFKEKVEAWVAVNYPKGLLKKQDRTTIEDNNDYREEDHRFGYAHEDHDDYHVDHHQDYHKNREYHDEQTYFEASWLIDQLLLLLTLQHIHTTTLSHGHHYLVRPFLEEM